jgi:FkbM family methyltransferase
MTAPRLNRDPYTTLRPFRHGVRKEFLCLKADSYIGESLKRYGEYSEGEVDVFRAFVREDDIVIDAGALFGVHTVPLAELCPRGMVLAFEPQRIPFQILCGNVQLNSMWNVDASRSSLGAQDGTTCFADYSPYTDNPWGLARANLNVTGYQPVRRRTIDGLGLTRLDFVKIDVEGSEVDVLQGAAKSLEQLRPVVYVEFNENRYDILRVLRRRGYDEIWRHLVPVAREPNFLGSPVDREGVQPRPSDMVLAVPEERIDALAPLIQSCSVSNLYPLRGTLPNAP